jgi:putative FmdB family regulatory protein
VPIYEYACRKCGEEFELLVLGSSVAACPACQNQDLEQLLSGFAVSSESTRQSNIKAAKRARGSSKSLKDERVAQAEEIKEHTQPH